MSRRARWIRWSSVLSGDSLTASSSSSQVRADRLHDRVVAVDQRVDERVGEIVRAHLADQRAAANARAHRLEHVAHPLVEAHHEVASEHEAHLLEVELGAFARTRHAADHELEVGIRLGFGPLADVDDVGQRQRVDLEQLRDAAQRALVPEALDLDPGDLAGLPQRHDLVDRHARAFEHALAVVAEDVELGRAGRKDDRSRRGADGWPASLLLLVASVRSPLARGRASRSARRSLARERVRPARRPR